MPARRRPAAAPSQLHRRPGYAEAESRASSSEDHAEPEDAGRDVVPAGAGERPAVADPPHNVPCPAGSSESPTGKWVLCRQASKPIRSAGSPPCCGSIGKERPERCHPATPTSPRSGRCRGQSGPGPPVLRSGPAASVPSSVPWRVHEPLPALASDASSASCSARWYCSGSASSPAEVHKSSCLPLCMARPHSCADAPHRGGRLGPLVSDDGPLRRNVVMMCIDAGTGLATSLAAAAGSEALADRP